MTQKLGKHLVVPALSVLIISSLAGVGILSFGSLASAIAYARGEEVWIDSMSKDLGDVPDGGEIPLSFTVRNLRNRPLSLMGARSSCSCTVVDNLPTTVPALGTREIRATIDVSGTSGVLAGNITIYTDSPVNREIVISYTGRVVRREAPDRVSDN